MDEILLELKHEWEEKAAKKATEKAEKAAKMAAKQAEKAANKAKKEGNRDGREAVAINMLKSGLYTQTAIVKATELPSATIKRLADSLA